MPVLLAIACAAAAIAFAVIPAGAGAVIVRLPSGKTLSYQPLRRAHAVEPFDALFSNVDYNGGPVMPSNTNYLIYWQPEKTAEYEPGFKEGIDRYFQDLAHDSGGTGNVDSVAAQYNDAAGEFANYQSTYGGELVDTHEYPKNGCKRAAICLTDAQIQTELKRFVKEQKLPIDLTHEYFLLTPPGVESCFEASGKECSAGVAPEFAAYCAYHGNVPIEGVGELIYANDPYVAGNLGCEEGSAFHPNGSPSDGELQGGLSHEHNESITDPEPNNAWTDFGGEIGEIGDKCELELGTPVGHASDGSPYNQVINGHFYLYQEEWSNQGHRCMQRLSFSGEVPQARFGVTGGSGDEVHFDASGSTAPGGVFRYDWQPNDPPESPPSESASSTLTHTFSAPGTYNVALTVFTSNGTGNGTACSVTIPVTDEPPTAAFTSPTEAVAPGTPVHFDGTGSTDEDGTIKSYTWSFGDGTPLATGATPTHEFASAGTYKVKLTVIDSDCMAATVTHTVVVAEPPSAAIGVNTLTPVAESPVAFEAKASAPGGSITAYAWNFGDGGESTEANPTHTYAGPGTYEVTLKVTNNSGQSTTVTRKVSVHAADELPTAEFTVGSEPTAGTPVQFDGTSSRDPDGEIVTYSWSFGDGGVSSEARPSHTYTAPGSYEVTLTVFDSEGLGARVTHTVTVSSPPAGGTGLTGGPFGGEGIVSPPPPPPPPPPPGKTATLTGTLALLGSTLPVRAGRTTAKVSCTGTAPACAGRLVLSLKTRVRVHGRLRTRTLTLASASFTIQSGRTATIGLTLSAVGRAHLRGGHGHLTVRLALVRTAPGASLTQESNARLVRR